VFDGGLKGLFERGVKQVGGQLPGGVQVRTSYGPADSLAHEFGEQHRILGNLGGLAESFQNRNGVPNGNTLS